MALSTHLLLFFLIGFVCNAEILPQVLEHVSKINNAGPYLGLVVPNTFELKPLLQPPNFIVDNSMPHVDISGKRFHIGMIADQKVIVVMTGLAMINAGITTQLLLSFFNIKGVVHYGIAGNGNPNYHIGDVTIPHQWAHTGLWNWQRYGQGENDELPLELNGDYTREIGYIHFAKYSYPSAESCDNLLNNAWYNPDEIFPIDGTPEVRKHAFSVNVSETYYEIAKQLENVRLESCVNGTTCLSTKPRIMRVERGCSATTYVDNAAYRNFLHEKFNCTPIDMESAAVALLCLSQKVPFIIIRSLSDFAGGSEEENKAAIFLTLASKNAVIVVTEFLKLFSYVETQNTPTLEIMGAFVKPTGLCWMD